MTQFDQHILIPNGYIAIPQGGEAAGDTQHIATVVSNLASLGFALDRHAFAALRATDLALWWEQVSPVLREVTGADRNMDEHIVYKNFPREVLDMDRASSVVRQIMIYFGAPYDAVREDEKARPPLGDITKLKVLTLADDGTASKIYTDLMAMPHGWSDNQLAWASALIGDRNAIVCADFGFKVNAIRLAAQHFDSKEFEASSGTDVLRLCAALSKGDITLREKVVLRAFKRGERRRLLAALDSQTDLADDLAMRPELWKRLLQRLRPGDYNFETVKTAYDSLYNKRTKPFSARVDPPAGEVTVAMLETVVTRPGEFLRRFHHFYDLFGEQAVERFVAVMPKLTTRQLAGFRAYLRTIGSRKQMIYPPKSNWARAQVVANTKRPIAPGDRHRLEIGISAVLKARLADAFPEGVALDDLATAAIKLQTNDQRLAEYGRGTTFDIPEDVQFLRSASFWAHDPHRMTTWFDNGWNFFDADWTPKGECCWNEQQTGDAGSKGAVFSGDPVNSRDLKGRGCQMIDLYPAQLRRSGIRYAVWSVLCYSKVKFAEATEVLATLQMGTDAESGRTYEPSRAQMVFPIKADALTCFVAYVDLETRKLIYMDANLGGHVSSAHYNAERLQKLMPAYVEYLESIPSVLELLQDAPSGTMPVLFDDKHTKIDGGRAFVFRPENPDNHFERVSVTDLTKL